MFKVVIADDERIIRDGISKMIDWESNDFSLVGIAKDGIEAMQLIKTEKPDIVITDIRMPGMDGFELIKSVIDFGLAVEFVVLSGYGEFEYAKKSMELGVKHYLLKPTSEEEILKVLRDLHSKLTRKRAKDNFDRMIKEELGNVKPIIKEQLIRDYIMDRRYTKEDFLNFCTYFGIDSQQQVRLVLFRPEKSVNIEVAFSLRNIAEGYIGNQLSFLSTNIKDNILIITSLIDETELFQVLEKIRVSANDYFDCNLTISYSDVGIMSDIPFMYKDAVDCLKYRFYISGEGIISKNDTVPEFRNDKEIDKIDYDEIEGAILSGNTNEVGRIITKFFYEIEASGLDDNNIKIQCMDLFMVVIKQSGQEDMAKNIEHFANLQKINCLLDIKSLVVKVAMEITEKIHERIAKKYSKLIEMAMEVVEKNIHNEDLTLRWVASNILYTNVDYLGKLFKKEMGENFSYYVVRTRMEKAKKLILEEKDVKIYEIAERVGFGGNSQYFSQVFKKYAGVSPGEFKNNN